MNRKKPPSMLPKTEKFLRAFHRHVLTLTPEERAAMLRAGRAVLRREIKELQTEIEERIPKRRKV